MRNRRLIVAASAALALIHVPQVGYAAATSDGALSVTFRESAPKDSFTIRNDGNCGLGAFAITIDLAGSAGGMIFDTVGTGPGLQVFQPFELVSGANRVTAPTNVADGGTVITLNLTALRVGEDVSFTIDVDDTLKQSARGQTQVTGAEIAGATMSVASATGATARSAFGSNAVARLTGLNCRS